MLIPGGMHQEALKKGDIILSAAQTKALLTTGKANGVGHSYAMGSILGSAYDRGSGLRPRQGYSSGGGGGSSGGGGGHSSGGGGGRNSGGGGGDGGGGEASAEAAKDTAETLDWIEVLLKRIEDELQILEDKADSAFSTLIDRSLNYAKSISKAREEINYQAQAYQKYVEKVNSIGLSDDFLNKIKNGAMLIEEITDEDLKKKISEAQDFWDKAQEAYKKQLELLEKVNEYYKDVFDTVEDNFKDQIDLLENEHDLLEANIDLFEERGNALTGQAYAEQMRYQEQIALKLSEERTALIKEMREAMVHGDIKEGSEAYYEMLDAIRKVEIELVKTEKEMEKLANSVRDLKWKQFEELEDKISDIIKEADFLDSLIDKDSYKDEEGNYTDNGLAHLGLVAMRYDTYMSQARDYYKQIEKLDEQYKDKQYDVDYLKKRQEWVNDWRDAIKNAYSEREEMQKAYEDQLESEKDALDELIDKKKEMLRADREEFEYRRDVTDQQKKILSLQKQLLSLQGDDSEEGAANRQKLADDLQSAQEDLQDKIEDKRISDTEKLLDNLYSDYEDFINNKLDEVTSLSIEEIIALVNGSQEAICATLKEVAADVGYEFQTAIGDTVNSKDKKKKLATTFDDGTADSKSKITEGIAKTKKAENAKVATRTKKEAATVKEAQKKALYAQRRALENSSENQFRKYGDWAYVYDYNYYRNKYKDLQKAFGDDEAKYFEHFKTYGMKEGRQGNILFDPRYYKSKYKDLQNAFGNDMRKYYEHFIQYGMKEHRSPSARFDFEYYKKNQKDVAKAYGNNYKAYYKHYLIFGQHEKRSGAKGYASGSKRVPSSGNFWTQENGDEVIIRASDNALLTRLQAGDMVLDKDSTANLWRLVNNPEAYIKGLSGNGINLSALGGGNTSVEVNMMFNLPKVTDAESFMTELRNSSRFEQLVQEITLGRINGNARLKKRSISI